jgi:predicted GIY-YIG superfamily endonuclease
MPDISRFAENTVSLIRLPPPPPRFALRASRGRPVLRSLKNEAVATINMMYYVYMLHSIPNPGQTYIGFTENLKTRLASHNSGQSSHTAKFKPWELITYFAFSDRSKALSFEPQ